jgi:hypothetical protein
MSFGLESDRTVRDAVEAYLEGRRKPDLWGHVWFETRNGRYTLVDGVLVGAKAEALVGAELVGWLEDRNGERAVHARWAPGAKAVLVDRRAGKQLVVTSSVKRLGVDERDRANTTAPPPRLGSTRPEPWTDATTVAAPPRLPAEAFATETTITGRVLAPATTPPQPLSTVPPPDAPRLPSPLPPSPNGARSPLTALAQAKANRSSIGARAAAALAAKGLAAPGVPLPARRSPMTTPVVPPPNAGGADGDGAVVPSE